MFFFYSPDIGWHREKGAIIARLRRQLILGGNERSGNKPKLVVTPFEMRVVKRDYQGTCIGSSVQSNQRGTQLAIMTIICEHM